MGEEEDRAVGARARGKADRSRRRGRLAGRVQRRGEELLLQKGHRKEWSALLRFILVTF